MRPPFAYYGGKGQLAPWIASMLPPHRVYIEPFAGSAAVLLAKEPAKHEVLNDLDGNLITFFRVLREQPEELVRVLELTPYSRVEFGLSDPNEQGISDVERARRYWVRVNQSFNKNAEMNNGWSVSVQTGASSARTVLNRIERLPEVVRRLMGTIIENRPAIDVIRAFGKPDAAIYVDPPYHHDTRTGTSGYVHDFGPEDHARLAEALHETPAAVLLSGYPSSLYDDLYGDWQRIDRPFHRRSTNPNNESQAKVVESIWTNRSLVVEPPEEDAA